LMSLFRNLTNIYISLGELSRIDSVSKIALNLWNPRWKSIDSKLAILNNLGIAQAIRGDTVGATVTLRKAYHEAAGYNNIQYIQKGMVNLGSLKGMIGDLDSAYFFFNEAANISRANTDMETYMGLMINLANIDREKGRYKKASITYDTVYNVAERLENTENLANVQNARANLYAKMGQFEQAFDYLNSFINIREKYLDEERVKSVTEMMEKYESEKKARQIQQLEVDKLDAALANEQIKNTRNRYMYIGIGVLLLAIGIWTRLLYMRRSRSAIQREKDISEGLLLNILPESVANELKLKGHADAKHYPLATILFSDFKNFTPIASEMNAADLVLEINICFQAFDNIITTRGIEKIKTIGDSYMAAGSIPENNTATALDVVYAGLEMQQFVNSRKKERDALQLPAFEMRVGIHSGPVVAGIVGVKKFQYDLWGDTVNIASRMESNAETGSVNISEATYQLIKDNKDLTFISRGMVHAKGKGEMAMYFVNRIPS
ncbi:MAG TPA: adenylate/guanylate cyclase domain-containing protein, partial [Saprospiraceae bacterium]|nr:adenylate/guanylate cyclase domain-containing protein [Saprospiraceae bacterium]